ncbi:MAG: DEAD/DEAH box helicase [Deltaproteobacteria bacterium HGW-Deltaproteobacteria-14]|jgi:HrpA-like RNA helicase|nr:MAG: DEAD/DEAH box helicase [Deltaproteobacteria bacterium HGW-Deltaproteobacteria-14]
MDPKSLPIYNHEEEIARALERHRVVVIEGPTGSGKTTQLPKILLQRGLSNGVIGMTQPRRIAAVSVAWRIAAELDVNLGAEVGYAIRFDDRTSRATEIKVMTDGILLMEARTDPDFSRYGVIIVDEAHERTLNIDFTLGLLHRALSRRPDLKVVVSSATLLPEVFQRYFAGVAGDEVPVVSIDARPFPVEIRYQPPSNDGPEAVMDAVAREVFAIEKAKEEGAILVFLSGEAMIKGTRELIEMSRLSRDMEVMPLYGKLTREEQEAVFDETPGKRKIVLSTNIAETSITVPDVRFVIDSGLAKVPRVNQKTGITTLREEGISQASAEQRAGRAGRTAPGRAIRLYSKRAFMQRPEYTDEEILRLELSDVVLRLINLGVHDIEDFPLPTPPPTRALHAALDALHQMGAIDRQRHLTPVGERMMPFPLTPALARMVVEAADRYPDVVDEVLMVGAFLSARPPYLYPQGEESQARAAQEQLAQPLGDALTAVHTLKLYLRSKNIEGYCAAHYLDPNIMAFVAKAHGQLSDIAKAGGIEIRGGGDPTQVVRAVAVGFANGILRQRGRVYDGPGDMTIAIHPSSSLFGNNMRYVVAADIVVSNRAYARFVSAMKAEWVLDTNPELAHRWGIEARKKKGRRDELPEPKGTPKSLQLGDVYVPVVMKKGRPFVPIPVEEAARLHTVSLSSLPAQALKWRAVLEQGNLKWGRGTSLAELLCLLPHIPLPDGAPTQIADVPLGALLESDRNIHTLGRFVDRVLEPGLPQRGRNPGWLTLVSNGETAFWFEMVDDFPDALGTTLHAVKDLMHALPLQDALHPRLEELVDRLDARMVEVEHALDAAARITKRR